MEQIEVLKQMLLNIEDYNKNLFFLKKITKDNKKYISFMNDIYKKNENNKVGLYIDFYYLISYLYEEFVVKNNRNYGIYYTEKLIIQYMVNGIKEKFYEKKIKSINILEPAAGTGLFIIEILKFLILEKKEEINKILSFLKNNVFLIDIDKNALDLFVFFINIFFKKNYNIKNKILIKNIHNNDFLLINLKQKFDIIISNPPYGISGKKYKKKFHDVLSENDNNVQNDFLPNDIYGYFYLQGFLYLKRKGILYYITPNSILNNKTFYGIRKYLFDYLYDIDIINNAFKKKKIGKKANIDTTIVKIIKKKNLEKIIIRKLDIKNNNIFEKGKKIINKKKLGRIFLLPLSEYLNEDIINFLYKAYKSKKYKLIKDFFDSAMGIKTANNKKYVSNVRTKKHTIPFVKGTSKEEQKYKVTIYDYINFQDLLKDKPKNSNIPNKRFLDLNTWKLGIPEIGHKGLLRCFLYKDMLVSNSIWIYIPKKEYKNIFTKEKLEEICKILNSKIYEDISRIYSNGVRIEKYIVDNLPLVLDIKERKN